MLLNFIKNPCVMMVVCAALVFVEMFIAKRWFLHFTKKIKSAQTRRGVNVLLGILTCIALALGQTFAMCDVLHVTMQKPLAFASGLIANFVYLIIEKIWGESKVNELGEIFQNFISHSDIFEGELSSEGMVNVAKKLFNIADGIDQKKAAQENEAVEKVCMKLEEFLADGVISAEEEAEAKKLLNNTNVTETSTYEKYAALLKK